ncbi:unnamed protein product [Hydatigera taeniaeformis]|uniref:Fibronectin type-III domain-containing protein n=1 Tax=Hydatigena taeniaeformis TaxID=6205 RepID=A0A0R3XCY4_HYDTA|nr:unnamed protein product [Hydatigera taeniaeformis]
MFLASSALGSETNADDGARSIQLSWDEHKVRGRVPNTVYLLATPNGAAEPSFEEEAEFSVGSITFDGLQPDTQYSVLLTSSIGAYELMEHRTAIKMLRDGESQLLVSPRQDPNLSFRTVKLYDWR